MTIIYLHQYFTLPDTSGGTRSYDLAKKFTSEGNEVIIVTTSASLTSLNFTKKWTVVEHEGLTLHVLKLDYSNKMSFLKRILVFFKFLVASSYRVIKIKGDVLIATSTPLTIAVPAIVKKTFSKTPFIFEVRDVWPEVPIAMGIIKGKAVISLLNFFERYIYKTASHVVVLSDDMKASILSRIAIDENKISVIPNIAELTRFSVYDSKRGLIAERLGYQPKKVVLYAGTLGMVNGLRYVIELAAHTITYDEDIKYIIFGDGREKDELLQLATEKGILNKNVFFFDPVSKSQLAQLYHECTVATSFVIPVPALWANSANKFFDSLAAAKPIVINHEGWQADTIRKYNVGYVLPFNVTDAETEARLFCNYLNKNELIAQQGINAQLLARKKYSLEIASKNYLQLLQNID